MTGYQSITNQHNKFSVSIYGKKSPNYIFFEKLKIFTFFDFFWNDNIWFKTESYNSIIDTLMPPKLEYSCEECKFSCSLKRQYNQHIKSFKHRLAVGDPTLDRASMISCKSCGELFGSRTTLWRHKKMCLTMEYDNSNSLETVAANFNNGKIAKNTDGSIDTSLLSEVLEETKNLREAFLVQSRTIADLKRANEEQHRIIEESLPKMGTTNNITNVMNNCSQNFNINLFLNEQCKDALNLSEFVKSIVVQIEDLERTRNVGFVKGVTDIIVRNLRQLDVYSRPIHCSDAVQEIMYVKNDDIWAEDTKHKPMVRGAIDAVAKMQIEKVKDWEAYKYSSNGMDTVTAEYISLVKQATNTENYDQAKIIKNIAREVVLNKSSK